MRWAVWYRMRVEMALRGAFLWLQERKRKKEKVRRTGDADAMKIPAIEGLIMYALTKRSECNYHLKEQLVTEKEKKSFVAPKAELEAGKLQHSIFSLLPSISSWLQAIYVITQKLFPAAVWVFSTLSLSLSFSFAFYFFLRSSCFLPSFGF